MTADAHRSYQDNPFINWRHESIPAELENVRPHGDFVLLRVIPEPEMHAGLIVMPTGVRERGYQPPRVGQVMACGKGDRMFPMRCSKQCSILPPMRLESARSFKCPDCGSALEFIDNPITGNPVTFRAPMHVKPGDKVLFWRVPANGCVIGDEFFVFVHEEQHILAVLEDSDGRTQ